MKNNNFLCLLLSFIFVLSSLNIFNVQAFAQDLDDVTVSGRITDANDAPVPGAIVTATLTTSGAARTVVADDAGRFRLIELAPGIYSFKATMTGFGAQEKTNIETVAGQNLRLDFKLLPAEVTAEQTVRPDDAPVVDPARTIVGGTVTTRELEEIPNISRSPLELVLTLGGTSEESLSTSGLADDRRANPNGTPLEQGNFSLSGGTAYSNNLTIDGLDNNDDRSSRERFQPSLEAVAEVQVVTNQFSAEYGRASGGRINLRTRAGDKRFRGRFFMFFRDDRLNANTWYNNSRAIPRPALTEYNPGFTLGGPLVLPFYDGKNKTFFFAAYEYGRLADTTLIETFVPVGANPRFPLPAATGSERSCDGTPATGSTPCNPADGAPTAAYIAPYTKLFSTPGVNHVATLRLDHKLFRNNDLTFGWQFGRKDNKRTSGAATTRLENAFQSRNSHTDAFNFTDNQVFGANTVNQFRAQYSVFKPSFQTDAPLDPVVLIGYRDPSTGSAKTLIAGNSTAGTGLNFADSRQETRWQFQDSLTFILGEQTLKTGFDTQRVRSQTLDLGDATGTFNFSSVLNYQNNVLARYRQNFGAAQDVENTYWSVFFNDEFRLLSNLTVNFGLRYERETAVTDKNNFGPRLGFAWDPFKKGRTVARFGAGIFYNRVLLRTVGDSIRNRNAGLMSFDSNTIGTGATDPRRTAILAAVAARFPASYPSAAELKNLIAATCASVATVFPCNSGTGFIDNVTSAGNPLRSVETGLRIPESYQFNLGFEREIGRGFVFEANYTWNKTAHLWRDYNPNAPVLPAGYADWTAYLLANPFELSPTRQYTFYLGSIGDGGGLATAPNGTTGCTTTTVNCFVNLNTINSSGTAPLVAVAGQNNNATGSPIGIALAALARFRPDPTVAETSRIGSFGRAFYHGLIVELRRPYRPLGYGFGASMRFVYTLSSTRDDGLNNTANAEINGDFDREWARNLQDRRHRLVFAAAFETPRRLGKLKFSPLVRFGSSAPFNLSAGGSDRNLDDLGTDRLNFSGRLKDIRYRKPGAALSAELVAQFSLQPIGAKSGNLPRNAGRGPAFFTFDLNVAREWRFGERFRLRPVVEFDNLLNAAVFSYGAEFIDFAALRTDGAAPTAAQLAARQNFLVPTRTYRPRELRLGLRFDF